MVIFFMIKPTMHVECFTRNQILFNTMLLAITGAIRGSSREKLYQELGFGSLQKRCWYRELCSFQKIFKHESPLSLFNIIPIGNSFYITRNHANIPLFKSNHNFFKNSFFPSTIIEQNNLDPNLRNSDTYETFKNTILKYIRPFPNSVFKCHNPQEIKFLTTVPFTTMIGPPS